MSKGFSSLSKVTLDADGGVSNGAGSDVSIVADELTITAAGGAIDGLNVAVNKIMGLTAESDDALSVFDISVFEYYQESVRALDLRQFAVGVCKGTVYGILIAIAGCLRGMQCGRSAQAVGQATTSAVVTSIVFIVIAASVLTILFQQLGI